MLDDLVASLDSSRLSVHTGAGDLILNSLKNFSFQPT